MDRAIHRPRYLEWGQLVECSRPGFPSTCLLRVAGCVPGYSNPHRSADKASSCTLLAPRAINMIAPESPPPVLFPTGEYRFIMPWDACRRLAVAVDPRARNLASETLAVRLCRMHNWRVPMTRLHKPIAALAFLLLTAISSSCTTGGPGARSLNEPANPACADGFTPKGGGSCDF